jgi:hypothetical protein
MALLAPLLFGLLLGLTLWQSRRPLRGRAWTLLRCLFPSWRFFEDVEAGPTLIFCVAAPGESFGPWRAALAPAQQRGIILNAAGNLALAEQSLVVLLLSELDGVREDAAVQLVAYRLVQRLLSQRARELGVFGPGARYKFRLGSDEDVAFESAEHTF